MTWATITAADTAWWSINVFFGCIVAQIIGMKLGRLRGLVPIKFQREFFLAMQCHLLCQCRTISEFPHRASRAVPRTFTKWRVLLRSLSSKCTISIKELFPELVLWPFLLGHVKKLNWIQSVRALEEGFVVISEVFKVGPRNRPTRLGYPILENRCHWHLRWSWSFGKIERLLSKYSKLLMFLWLLNCYVRTRTACMRRMDVSRFLF